MCNLGLYLFFLNILIVLFTSQYTSRSSSVVCIFFGLLGYILCRGFPNVLFFVAAAGTRTWTVANSNMVYQHLNNVGQLDPNVSACDELKSPRMSFNQYLTCQICDVHPFQWELVVWHIGYTYFILISESLRPFMLLLCRCII